MEESIVRGGLGRLISSVNRARIENRLDNGAAVSAGYSTGIPPFFASVRS